MPAAAISDATMAFASDGVRKRPKSVDSVPRFIGMVKNRSSWRTITRWR